MLSTSHQQRENASNSLKKLKVLTRKVNTSDNQFLNLLWNSVTAYGIEVAPLPLHYSVLQLALKHKIGDIVHIHWVHKFCKVEAGKELRSGRTILSNFLKLSIYKLRGYQIVWTVHNTISHECRTPGIEKQFRRILSFLCDDIVVMSEYSRQEFAQLYNRQHRVHVVPHGNYIGAYPNDTNPTVARQQLNIAPNQKVLLYLGRVMRYKGIDKLLAEFDKLEDPTAILLIAGSCSEPALRQEIEQAAQKNSCILPRLEFIPDEDIQIYMNACNWVVLPYRKILNSGSALLALSFGRPIIGPRKGSLVELIQDGHQGLTYKNDDELHTTLTRALTTSSKHWSVMCENAHNLAEKYDWETIGARLLDIYQQGIDRK